MPGAVQRVRSDTNSGHDRDSQRETNVGAMMNTQSTSNISNSTTPTTGKGRMSGDCHHKDCHNINVTLVLTIPSTTPTSKINSSSLTNSSSSSRVGPIVGGVIGGVVFIALILLGLLLYKRRRAKRTAPSTEFADYIQSQLKDMRQRSIERLQHLPIEQPSWSTQSGLHNYRSEKGYL